MKRKYFGTNGIRGVVGDLITPVFISKMSSAIASYMLDKGTMIIGSDCRSSSPFVRNNVISSFLAGGIEVIDIGTVPTPLLQYAVTELNAEMGIMVTASHNPPEFNGIKVIDSDGIEINIAKQKEIEKIYENETFRFVPWEKNTKVTNINVIPDYINQIAFLVDEKEIKQNKLTAVVDGGNGVGGLVTPLVLKKLGVRVVTINGHLDSHFPGRGVEPSPEKLNLMGEIVKQVGANFSIAHDGDADRAIFGDEKGIVHYGDKSIALFEKWVLKREDSKKFVTPISSSLVMKDIVEEMGGEIIWTPVGCIFVSRKMLESNSMLGGEENGGLFYAPHQSVRDGMMAAALMAEILAQTNTSFSELILDLPQYHQDKIKINCPENLKEPVMEFVINNIQETEEIIVIDGVKLIFSDGWSLIRPSGTEPIFRIFVEAKTKERVDYLMKTSLELVNKALNKYQD